MIKRTASNHSEPQRGLPHQARVRDVRQTLLRNAVDALLIPSGDEHLGEFVAPYARRLAWLSGFEGSVGAAAVTAMDAVLFVDGRYSLQARQQTDASLWQYEDLQVRSPLDWLLTKLGAGVRIGYDPWLHSAQWCEDASRRVAEQGGALVPTYPNLVDQVWQDQPPRVGANITCFPLELAGESSDSKRRILASWLRDRSVDGLILCALDSIAWVFNVRGSDVPRIPVAFSYAILWDDCSADLFAAAFDVAPAVRLHLGEGVRVHSISAFADALRQKAGVTLAVDPLRTPQAVVEAAEAGNARIMRDLDPVLSLKAVKNSAEIAGHKAAQIDDGVALARFLHWLPTASSREPVTEISAATALERFRREATTFRDLSFDTISAAGPHAASPHYQPSPLTDRILGDGEIYLVDSGGQYLEGTTDITRTVAIGTVDAEMRDRFTRVLKGHIALASLVFPIGTTGVQVDAFARQHLWAAGLDYAHGTGHGVGAYLCVHEGPAKIRRSPEAVDARQPLLPGMILSIEPGYYKAGEYGIRLENLALVVEKSMAGAETRMLGFEVLSWAPFDRALVDASLLDATERQWLNNYHAEVLRRIGPRLPSDVLAWVERACCPIAVTERPIRSRETP